MAKMTVLKDYGIGKQRKPKKKPNWGKRFLITSFVIFLVAIISVGVVEEMRTSAVKEEARIKIAETEAKYEGVANRVNGQERVIENLKAQIKKLNTFKNALIEEVEVEKFANQDLKIVTRKLRKEIKEHEIEIATLEIAYNDNVETLKIALEEKQEKIDEIAKLKIDTRKLKIQIVGRDENIKSLTDAVGIWSKRAVELQQQLEKTKKRGLFTVIGTVIAGAIGWIL